MGGGNSKEKDPLLKGEAGWGDQERQYNLPDGRMKDRFEPVEKISYTTSYEASIDKFDYLIVFPLTEHKGIFVAPVIDQGEGGLDKLKGVLADGIFNAGRHRWSTLKDIWRQASFGTDDAKEASVARLSKFWAKRTGSEPKDSDLIRHKAWNTVAREAILDQLINVSGLQCKLTATSKSIFCRVRAPMKLLELQADKENYRLQLRGEIDPGSDEFWNRELLQRDEDDKVTYKPVELDEEKKLYSREEAVTILEKLYNAGKISPNDLGIKDETQEQWSLRVHALERIADRVPVANRYPAFADFSTRPEKRHLYNTYPSVRGRTLFKPKDRLCLTKSILDTYYDFEMFAERGVIQDITALHDSNRGEAVTIDILYKRWVRWWTVSAIEAGSVKVTDPEYHNDVPCPLYKRPFAQPLEDIRDYFGEKLALHFAWLGFYSHFLGMLFIFSAAMCGIILYRGYVDVVDGYDWANYTYQLVVVFWSESFQNSWQQENQAINVKWGTTHLKGSEKVRPQFQGVGPLQRSLVDNSKIAVFPEETRRMRACSGYVVLVGLSFANLALIFGFFYAEYFVINAGIVDASYWLLWVVSAFHAFLLQTNAALFPQFAVRLNDYENYRTESDYENSLIFKTLLFQSTNNFAAATFTIFGKGYLFGDCYNDSCIVDLRVLLLAIIVVRMVITLWDLIAPVVAACFGQVYTEQKEKVGKLADAMSGGGDGGDGDDDAAADERQPLSQSDEYEDDTQFMEEIGLRKYKGTFLSYSEAVLQFGFVSLFSVSMPLLAPYALLENFLVLRIKAWRLCRSRRPHVEIVDGIGSWDLFVRVISYMGVVWGVGIQVFAGSNFDDFSTSSKFIVFLAVVQIVLYMKTCWALSAPAELEWVTTLKARNNFVYQKYLVGFFDDDDNLDLSMLQGQLDDQVDVDKHNLYDLRKGAPVTEGEYRAMGELEAKRRALRKEMKMSKDNLQQIYKTETFNDNTGIGETKHGLPLGRLMVNLIEIDGLTGEDIGDNIAAKLAEKQAKAAQAGKQVSMEVLKKQLKIQRDIKIKCSVRAARKGTKAAAPFGNLAFSDTKKLVNGVARLDQVMGPYAPIKTIDAEVFFNVLDTGADDFSIAFASIGLRAIQDQITHEKKLALKVKMPNGESRIVGNLYVKIQFQFSKVLPVRRRIFETQGQLREIEKKLSLIKAGKLKVDENGQIIEKGGDEDDAGANQA